MQHCIFTAPIEQRFTNRCVIAVGSFAGPTTDATETVVGVVGNRAILATQSAPERRSTAGVGNETGPNYFTDEKCRSAPDLLSVVLIKGCVCVCFLLFWTQDTVSARAAV